MEKTLMYSIHGVTGAVQEHRLPWDRNNKDSVAKFDKYLKRGFTFERPVVAVVPEPAAANVEKLVVTGLTVPGGHYFCPKCKKVHRETSKLGARQLKHRA